MGSGHRKVHFVSIVDPCMINHMSTCWISWCFAFMFGALDGENLFPSLKATVCSFQEPFLRGGLISFKECIWHCHTVEKVDLRLGGFVTATEPPSEKSPRKIENTVTALFIRMGYGKTTTCMKYTYHRILHALDYGLPFLTCPWTKAHCQVWHLSRG